MLQLANWFGTKKNESFNRKENQKREVHFLMLKRIGTNPIGMTHDFIKLNNDFAEAKTLVNWYLLEGIFD